MKTTSCEYSLTKNQTPLFTLSPTSISIACGDTTARTFTVNNVNNSSGTKTYSWSAYGWNLNGNPVGTDILVTSTNSITLTPGSATSSLSEVKVTPNLNGVNQPYKQCTVTLAPLTDSMEIIGNNAVCPSSTNVYSIFNLSTGSTVNWSSSDTSIATISSNSGNQITVNPVASQGSFVLTAVVTNACGQQKTLAKTLGVGLPMFFIAYTPSGLHMDLTLIPPYGAPALYEQGVDFGSISWNKISQTGGNVTVGGSGLYSSIIFPYYESSVTIEASIANSCGTATSDPLTLMPGYEDNRMVNLEPSISKISNDIYEIINVPVDISKVEVSVYDINGVLVLETNVDSQIDLSNLKAGIYIIKAPLNENILTLKIIKE